MSAEGSVRYFPANQTVGCANDTNHAEAQTNTAEWLPASETSETRLNLRYTAVPLLAITPATD